ncbi:hypothetical protein AB0P40_03990, partial [Streptomyces sp. NPDC079189]
MEREPFPWSVYRWLEGETETGDGLADPAGTATELAGFISALQGDRFHRRPGPRAEQRVPWCADGRRARLRGLRGARPAQDRGAAGHGRHRRGDGGAGPAASLEMGLPDDGSQPTSTTQRRAYDLLSDG